MEAFSSILENNSGSRGSVCYLDLNIALMNVLSFSVNEVVWEGEAADSDSKTDNCSTKSNIVNR